MLFRFMTVALGAALTLASMPLVVACESSVPSSHVLAQSDAVESEARFPQASTERDHRPELTTEPGQAATSQTAALDPFDPARFIQLHDGEMFGLLAPTFKTPEDTTGSIEPLIVVENRALDGSEDQ